MPDEPTNDETPLTRDEIVDALLAFQERRGDQVTAEDQEKLKRLFEAAAKNDGTQPGPKFTRAYQASFELAPGAEGRFEANAGELSSFLRLDLGDGGPLLEPKNGLIPAILATKAGKGALLKDLDLAAISHAAQTSRVTGADVRVNLKAEGSANEIGRAVANYPEANLVGEIVLGGYNPPTPQTVVQWARTLQLAGAKFALSNVVSAEQLTETLDALEANGLKPQTADLDFKLGLDLPIDPEAYQSVVDILRVAKNHDLNVNVTAVAVGTKEARSFLFAAVTEIDFDITHLRVSGRDLMAETVDIGPIEPFALDRLTGAKVELGL